MHGSTGGQDALGRENIGSNLSKGVAPILRCTESPHSRYATVAYTHSFGLLEPWGTTQSPERVLTFCRTWPAASFEGLVAAAAIALIIHIHPLPEAPPLLLPDRVDLRSDSLGLRVLCVHEVLIAATAPPACHLCCSMLFLPLLTSTDWGRQ